MTHDFLPCVRKLVNNVWQVLLGDDNWQNCRNELDARYIAHGLQLARAVRRGGPTDADTVDELEQARAALLRNIGVCQAERSLFAASELARTLRVRP
jgi:hypothetical protein